MKVNKMTWGTQKIIVDNPSFELHELFLRAGERCTIHYHKAKSDGWYVLSGKIKVVLFKDNTTEPIREEIIRSAEKFEILPGITHCFVGIEDSKVFEYFWTEHNSADKVVI